MEVRKYDKQNKAQVTMNGWDLAFRACGDRLIVIGEPRAIGVGTPSVELALTKAIDALCISVLLWVVDHVIFASRDRMASTNNSLVFAINSREWDSSLQRFTIYLDEFA
ncbi:hypothetical protein H5410_001253 [Solanum commersonii]|uniref:Uncharacterized protein n=1 Tax=Solanum commersonii TaxID=4109 RepID=A0A9J6AYH4_SOLCO|nr:hypothetical protein H5410_001253 [Solanum commersonii]